MPAYFLWVLFLYQTRRLQNFEMASNQSAPTGKASVWSTIKRACYNPQDPRKRVNAPQRRLMEEEYEYADENVGEENSPAESAEQRLQARGE